MIADAALPPRGRTLWVTLPGLCQQTAKSLSRHWKARAADTPKEYAAARRNLDVRIVVSHSEAMGRSKRGEFSTLVVDEADTNSFPEHWSFSCVYYLCSEAVGPRRGSEHLQLSFRMPTVLKAKPVHIEGGGKFQVLKKAVDDGCCRILTGCPDRAHARDLVQAFPGVQFLGFFRSMSANQKDRVIQQFKTALSLEALSSRRPNSAAARVLSRNCLRLHVDSFLGIKKQVVMLCDRLGSTGLNLQFCASAVVIDKPVTSAEEVLAQCGDVARLAPGKRQVGKPACYFPTGNVPIAILLKELSHRGWR